jgi:hypothetical protein
VTGSLHYGRTGARATLLRSGQVLVEGGAGGPSNSTLTSAELYNPATGTWSVTGSLHQARGAHTATLLPNDQVLVTGGGSSSADALASAELYTPPAGTGNATASAPGDAADQ